VPSDDVGQSESDLTVGAEDLVWRDLAQLFEDIFLTKELRERDIAVLEFLGAALQGYFQASTSSQIALLVLTWRQENNNSARLAEVFPGDAEDINGERLEEPLCWRRIPNDAGLSAFAADVIVWTPASKEEKEIRPARGSKASKSRGFDTRQRKETRLSMRFKWQALKLIMHEFCLINDNGTKPRVLFPQGTFPSLKKIGVQNPEAELGVEMSMYAGKLSWQQLVSDSNSVVVVFLESPQEHFWSLPAEILDKRTKSCLDPAPILLLSIQQLDVNFNIPGIMKKLRRWLLESENEAEMSSSQDEDIFTQWTSMLPLPLSPFGGELRARIAARRNYIRSKLGSLIRKVFANKRAKLRAERLPQLLEAQQRMTQQLRRQRELRARAKIVLAELEEAIQKLDWESYEKKLAQAESDQLLDQKQLQDVQHRWAEALGVAEAPLKEFVQTCLAVELQEAQVLLVLSRKLEEELVASTLPHTCQWMQVALELRRNLEALHEVHSAVTEIQTSSSSVPGDQLKNLTQELHRAEGNLEALELAFGRASGTVESDCTRSFKELLKQCKNSLKKSCNDQKLEEVLNAVPWEKSKRLFAGITMDACEKLQAASDAASEKCRSRMEGPLEEAWAVAKAAKDLRCALEGHDEALLDEMLKEAEKHSLIGLEGAKQQFQDLQIAKSALRHDLSVAVSSLDLTAFELLANQNSAQLSTEELQSLRKELQSPLQEEERVLQEVLTSGQTENSLRTVLQKCRLLPSNPWRKVAQDSIKALDAARSIRDALRLFPDESILQASLSSGSKASKELEISLQQVQLQDQGELNSPSFHDLQKALDEGYLGLAGAQKDQSLESLLNSPPWREASWEDIQPSDLRQLEVRVQEASKHGQERLAQEVHRAFEVGRCAVDLSNAMGQWDLEKLEKLHAKAHDLKMSGLEKVRARIQRISSKKAQISRSSQVALSPNAVMTRTRILNDDQSTSSAGRYESPVEVREERCQNLIFLDLELTSGFYDFEEDPEILEVAVIVTDKDMEELERGHWVLGGFSRQELESLGDFHKANFRDAAPGGEFPPLGAESGNGLFSDVMASRLSLQQVESEVTELIERHCPAGECPLVGYSVQCDREVIKDKMPRLYRHLSHQIIDVSGFFKVARYWLPDHWQDWDRRSTTYNHRALNDAEDAIEAMRWVRQKFYTPNWASKETKQLSALNF